MDRNDKAREAFREGLARTSEPQIIVPGGDVKVERQPAGVPRLGIVVPSGDLVNANFAMCLASATYKTGIPISLWNMKGSNIATNRSNGAMKCQEWGADYCLMIDADMGFPSDAPLRLLALARKHDLDIVGCSYVSRVQPHQNHAKPLPGKEQVKGLAEVAGLPTGMLMFNMHVLDKLKRPYFRMAVVEEGEPLPEIYRDMVPEGFWGSVGEDYDFCARARATGCKVWLDVPLSTELVHYGEVGFRLRNTPNDQGKIYDSLEIAA